MNEFEFVGSTLTTLPQLLRTNSGDVALFREVSVSRSIADIVLFRSPNNARRFSAPLSVTESIVLSALRRHGPTRIDMLEKRCGVGVRGFRMGSALQRLVAVRLIRRSYGGFVYGSSTWLRGLKLVAVEAKLGKWRQALRQALIYRRYADESYVMLPEASASVASGHLQDFEKAGVGLIGVSGMGKLNIVWKPSKTREHDWRREFVCSRLLAPALTSGARFTSSPPGAVFELAI